MLNNGCFQLPIFSSPPYIVQPPLTIEKLTKLEKIPCSSILIWVEKGLRDLYGKPKSYDGKTFIETVEGGAVSVAPKYNSGKYNNLLNPVTEDEELIFQYKVKRPDSHLKTVMVYLKESFKRQKIETLDEITEWAKTLFKNVSPENWVFLNMNFFSQCIPEFGLRFGLEMILRGEPKSIYIATMSLNPPGSLYKTPPVFEKSVLFTEIDWESKQSAQKFSQELYTFWNLPLDLNLHFIIDIKEFNTKDKIV